MKFKSKIIDFWQKSTEPTQSNMSSGLIYWQEKILLSLTLVMTFAAGIAYFPSIYFAYKEELYSVFFVDTLAYIFVIALYSKKNISIRLRGVGTAFLAYFMGVFLLVFVGPQTAAYLWLFTVPPIVAILVDTKTAVISNIIVAVTMGAIGYLIEKEIIVYSAGSGYTITSWIIISVNLVFLDIVLTVSILFVSNGLTKTLNRQQKIASDLVLQKENLKEAKAIAENALEMKDVFLAQISHEIRTPVNTILSYVSLIKYELSDEKNNMLSEYFNMINNGSRRLIRTIDMILNMSEIETNTYSIKKSDLDLYDEVLLPLYNEFKQLANEKKLKFSIRNYCRFNIEVFADKYTITQLFVNLIENSIKYTEKGEISIVCNSLNDEIIISIEDTGIGISDDYIEEIFHSFSQEQSGYTRKFDGLGLGLTLVERYAKLNGAFIEVKSKKNKGTEFQVKLQLSGNDLIISNNKIEII